MEQKQWIEIVYSHLLYLCSVYKCNFLQLNIQILVNKCKLIHDNSVCCSNYLNYLLANNVSDS